MTSTRIEFDSFPCIDELTAALAQHNLKGPFSIEIEQDGLPSRSYFEAIDCNTVDDLPSHQYFEVIDCNTVDDLHEFLCNENGFDADIPFVLDIEEVDPAGSEDRDHPSLTAQERNPSLT